MDVKLLFLTVVLLSSPLLTLCDPLFVLSAPNLLRVGSSENVFVEAQDYSGGDLNVKIIVNDHPNKHIEICSSSVTLTAGNNFQILTDIMIPDDRSYFSDDPLEKQYVFLQAQFPSVTLEKVVMLLFQSGYIFVQTDKPIYTPASTESGDCRAHLADKNKSHELEMYKLRAEWQKDKIDELTKERDYLKEQLASALKREDTGSSQAVPLSSDSSSDGSDESSSETMSDSSSTSSLEVDRKKKRTKSKGNGKKHGKKSKKIEMKTRQRAQTPQQVVSRYKKILWHFSKGRTMSAAFKRVGVDRNTVAVNAPIAELYIAAPDKFKELLKNHSSQVKLSAFATQCAAAINEDSAIEDRIKALKASGKLLPLKRK